MESRGQGDSDAQPGYEPRQWVTGYETRDTQAALAYLKARPDADPKGIGFFGISKGGSAGVIVAAADPYVRCCVTDGIFSTRRTVILYMQKWVAIVSTRYWLQRVLPAPGGDKQGDRGGYDEDSHRHDEPMIGLPPGDEVVGLRPGDHLERLDAHQRPETRSQIVHALNPEQNREQGERFARP